ncbi:hypothetical protein Bbelb_302340 [Branchiostoma belcheri]|nr:hypothetical protein Bbelb_302340 [Branchiostoma belcheri]
MPFKPFDVRKLETHCHQSAEARALKKLLKAAGLDEITAEMLKYGGDANQTGKLLLAGGAGPQGLADGVIVKLLKKGDLSDCNYRRGITLLSIPGKLADKSPKEAAVFLIPEGSNDN